MVKEALSMLTIKEVTVLGLLICACFFLIKANMDSLKKIDLEHKKMDLKRDNEMSRILGECKEMKDERKIERKEWLHALEGNTKELNNIAQKLEIIPAIKDDIGSVRSDVESVKNKVNFIENEMNIKRIVKGANKNE